PENKLTATPHGLLVCAQQFWHALQTGLVMGMPEPMILSQRRIRLNRPPTQIAVPVDDIPVLVRDDSVFVPHPANIAILKKRHICEYERVRLQHAQLLHDAWKVVDMSATAGAVQPELLELTIPLRQFV